MRLLRSDLPLASDAASRFLPWIAGLMVYLAALALAAALAIDGVAERWHVGLVGSLTVQLEAPSDGKPASRLRSSRSTMPRCAGWWRPGSAPATSATTCRCPISSP